MSGFLFLPSGEPVVAGAGRRGFYNMKSVLTSTATTSALDDRELECAEDVELNV